MRHPRVSLRIAAAALLCVAVSAWAQQVPADPPSDGRLSLGRAFAMIPLRNPDVGLADIAVRQAEADQQTAGERPNGALDLSTAGINTAGHNGGGTYWDKYYDTVVSFSQTFERGHKRRFRLAQADAGVEAARYDYRDALRQARLAVSNAYWELKRSEEKLATAEALAQIEHRSLGAAEARLKLGDVPALDVQRIRVEAAQADGALDAARNARSDAQVALAALLAMNGQYASLTAADPWPGADQAAGPAPAQAGKAERADVAAAERRVQAAEAALDGAHALRHRDITVNLQYEHAPAPGPPPIPGNGNTLLGVGVSIPIFTGNGYHGEIARAHADLDAAEAARDKVRLQAESELDRARADLAAAAARAARYDGDLLGQARQALQAAETAYARGGLGLTDLLDARRALKAVEDSATDAHADYAEALAALQAADPTTAETSTP